MTGISAAVLAGGQSKRMGFNKALADFRGRPLIEHVVARLKALTPDVIVVSKTPELYTFTGVKSVPDAFPRHSSLVGIYSALQVASGEHCLVVACDMPFLNLDLLRYLGALAPYHDVVMPVLKQGPEPLHAVYSRRCLGPIEDLIAAGENKILKFLPHVRVRYVDEAVIRFFDPELLSFVNVNTPSELEQARRFQGMDGRGMHL